MNSGLQRLPDDLSRITRNGLGHFETMTFPEGMVWRPELPFVAGQTATAVFHASGDFYVRYDGGDAFVPEVGQPAQGLEWMPATPRTVWGPFSVAAPAGVTVSIAWFE